jgi:hypothetical protein
MADDLRTTVTDHDQIFVRDDLEVRADQVLWNRVASRSEVHHARAIDLAQLPRAMVVAAAAMGGACRAR